MKPENWIALSSALLSTFVTAFGLYLGPKLAVRRTVEQFRSTKWWEKQQEAYSILLGHISTIRYDARLELAAIEEGYDRARGKFLQELTRTAYFEVERFTAQGDYLISTDSARALQFLQKTLDKWSALEGNDRHNAYSKRLEAATECIATLTKEAKRALLESGPRQP